MKTKYTYSPKERQRNKGRQEQKNEWRRRRKREDPEFRLKEYQQDKLRYARNAGRHIAAVIKWQRGNPEQVRVNDRHKSVIRRARKRQACVGDSQAIKDFYRHAITAERVDCAYCGRGVPKGQRHVDHAIPLVRGGQHGVENLAVACATCNLRKSAMTADEFRALLPPLAALVV